MHTVLKRLSLLAAAFILSLPSHSAHAKDGKPLFAKAGPITVQAKVISSFDKGGPPVLRYGGLEWRGGLVLTSSSKNFGGWSGLTFQPNSNRFMAVSDAGTWMSGELVYRGNRPDSVRSAYLGPLLKLNGKPVTRNRDRDAESIALISGTLERGTALVAFERNDRIGRFRIQNGRLRAPTDYYRRPRTVRRFGNTGFEAVTELRGGRYRGAVLTFAEEPPRGERLHRGWMWLKTSKKPVTFQVAGLDDYAITDAASLKDGSLILLERRFRWTDGVRMRLRKIPAAAIRPGRIAKGEVLLVGDLSNEIDNMEGLAVRDMPSGEVRITLISDDNFNSLLQRTVLLEFAIPAPAKPAAKSKQPKG